MTHWIVGIDSANGVQNVSGIRIEADGKHSKRKDVAFPSLRNETAMDMDTDIGIEATSYEYWTWEGFNYVIGVEATQYGGGSITESSGRSRFGDGIQLSLIAAGLYKLGLKHNDSADICLLAPPQYVKTAKQMYLSSFDAMNREITISRNGGKHRTFRIGDIHIQPEAVAVKAAFSRDDDNVIAQSTPFMGKTVAIYDGGKGTLDRVVFRNGKLDRELLAQATDDTLGIGAVIIDPIAEKVRYSKPNRRELHKALPGLIDLALQNRSANGNGYRYHIVRAGSTPLDITTDVDTRLEVYYGEVRKTIDADRARFGITKIMLIGGLDILAGEYLRTAIQPDGKVPQRRDYPSTEEYKAAVNRHNLFINFKDYPVVKKISPTQINAVGALRFAISKRYGK